MLLAQQRDLYASLILFLRGIHSLRRSGSSNGRPHLVALSLSLPFRGVSWLDELELDGIQLV